MSISFLVSTGDLHASAAPDHVHALKLHVHDMTLPVNSRPSTRQPLPIFLTSNEWYGLRISWSHLNALRTGSTLFLIYGCFGPTPTLFSILACFILRRLALGGCRLASFTMEESNRPGAESARKKNAWTENLYIALIPVEAENAATIMFLRTIPLSGATQRIPWAVPVQPNQDARTPRLYGS